MQHAQAQSEAQAKSRGDSELRLNSSQAAADAAKRRLRELGQKTQEAAAKVDKLTKQLVAAREALRGSTPFEEPPHPKPNGLAKGAKNSESKRSATASSLQGTWMLKSLETEGVSFSGDLAGVNFRVAIADSMMTMQVNDKQTMSTFRLDDSATPRQIDMTEEDGPNQGQVVQGIYKIEEGLLSICVAGAGKPRPLTFAAPAGSGAVMMVLKRVQGP